ncbi:unnamed protein product [Trichogramma brassicae]|uniref:Uncharacterized protein n=1 Tax=Trichogramma brassicae TaxID=86971 RepID=A0A6H5J4F4_9HYME|nr:unnamed protein product [Trichogramma brassicae]
MKRRLGLMGARSCALKREKRCAERREETLSARAERKPRDMASKSTRPIKIHAYAHVCGCAHFSRLHTRYAHEAQGATDSLYTNGYVHPKSRGLGSNISSSSQTITSRSGAVKRRLGAQRSSCPAEVLIYTVVCRAYISCDNFSRSGGISSRQLSDSRGCPVVHTHCLGMKRTRTESEKPHTYATQAAAATTNWNSSRGLIRGPILEILRRQYRRYGCESEATANAALYHLYGADTGFSISYASCATSIPWVASQRVHKKVRQRGYIQIKQKTNVIDRLSKNEMINAITADENARNVRRECDSDVHACMRTFKGSARERERRTASFEGAKLLVLLLRRLIAYTSRLSEYYTESILERDMGVKKCRSMGSISRSIRVVYSSAMPKYVRLRGCARYTRRRIRHEEGRQKNARSRVTRKLSDSSPFRSFNNITISTCIGATAV